MTKFYIDHHGCAKNQTDGELITGFLTAQGFEHTFDAKEADFIIINSCGFIESAKKESIQAIYSLKSDYPEAKIILAGCLAERYAQMFYDSMEELDGVFGNGDLSKICDFMKQVSEGKRIIRTYEQKGICEGKRPVLYNFPSSAYVKITEGCSNHCSFCAIPVIRGELRSRKAQLIISEIKELIEKGIYEINIIGQDIAAYGTGTDDINIFENTKYEKESESAVHSKLYYLLKLICELQGDFLIRLLYIHPDHFNKDILEVIKNDERIAHYFDIPFQSGADNIIISMNRTGSKKTYENLVEQIRSELPDCVLRTTFLTGFPGETDKDAEQTKDFLLNIQPDWSGCFAYSREEDTPSYTYKKRVPAKVAEKRASVLEELQSKITENKLQKYVKSTVDVLIEEIIQINPDVAEDSSEGLAIGRSWFQAPDVDGCVVIRYDADSKEESECIVPGNVVSVKIISSTGVDLDSRFLKLRKQCQKSSNI